MMPENSAFRLIGPLQEGEWFARSLEIYCDAIVTNMLPAINVRVDHQAEMILAEEQCTILEGPLYDPLWHWRLEIGIVRHHALAFAFVAVFHLFERQVGQALNWMHHRSGRTASTAKGGFCALLNELEKAGVPINSEFRREADRLRMITNVAKHSSRDLRTIALEHPDLVLNWRSGMQVSPDMLALTADLLQSFVSTLASFWRAFPHE